MEIVCDTNIWYDLGEKIIAPEIFKDHKLIATFYNFEELNSTPNLIGEFPKVKRAGSAIVEHSTKQILENSILYISQLLNPSYEDSTYQYSLGMRNWGAIRGMNILPDDFTPSEQMIKEFKVNIENRVEAGKELANSENLFVESKRKAARKQWKINKSQYFDFTAAYVLHHLNEFLTSFSKGTLQLSKLQEIKDITLFFHVYIYYHKKLMLSPTMKVEANDLYDLYNLVYVKPGMKYCTKETRWTDIINEAGLSEYLFTVS